MKNTQSLSVLERMPEPIKFGLVFIFVIGVYLFAKAQGVVSEDSHYLIIAAVVGAYMALNIGANDVANNVGPSVGSGALTMGGAVIIAVIFESLGAIIAGGDVIKTIKGGIIDPSLITDPAEFIWLMLAALIAAGIWLNAATAVGAPVSTTHSIVGGVLGAGIAAGGWHIVDWGVMGNIAASWVISPVMGGVIAAALLFFIKKTIYYSKDKMIAARRIIPMLIGLMAWAFTTYLLIKGTKRLFAIEFWQASLIGLIVAAVIILLVKPRIDKATIEVNTNNAAINELFTIPLIISSAILSFAHGANDVANAVGPLAAINDAIQEHGVHAEAAIPLWIMLIGALGIATGLALFGPKLIHTVGTGITSINKVRAFCIAMAASITVIIASQLGLPISSTHVAVGAVFGVGFLREILTVSYDKIIAEVREHHEENNQVDQQVQAFLDKFEDSSIEEKTELLQEIKDSSNHLLSKKERKSLKSVHKEELVQRSVFLKIIAAWFITVPSSAFLSAFFFFTLKGFFS